MSFTSGRRAFAIIVAVAVVCVTWPGGSSTLAFYYNVDAEAGGPVVDSLVSSEWVSDSVQRQVRRASNAGLVDLEDVAVPWQFIWSWDSATPEPIPAHTWDDAAKQWVFSDGQRSVAISIRGDGLPGTPENSLWGYLSLSRSETDVPLAWNPGTGGVVYETAAISEDASVPAMWIGALPAGESREYVLEFHLDHSATGGFGWEFRGFFVSTTPEPSTAAFLALGVLLITWRPAFSRSCK